MISSVLLAGFCEMELFNAPINMKRQHSPGKPTPPLPLHSPQAFEVFKTGLFKFPWFPTPLAQVMVKYHGFTRRDKFRVDRRIIVI